MSDERQFVRRYTPYQDYFDAQRAKREEAWSEGMCEGSVRSGDGMPMRCLAKAKYGSMCGFHRLDRRRTGQGRRRSSETAVRISAAKVAESRVRLAHLLVVHLWFEKLGGAEAFAEFAEDVPLS